MPLPGFAGNISSCTQHSRRAAPLDPSPVMQSCAARLNARLTKQSVNCELLCIIDLSTFTQRVQAILESQPLSRTPLLSDSTSCGNFPFAYRQFGKPFSCVGILRWNIPRLI